MNVLIVGAGSGSWEMRGKQLGAALGARVTSAPVAADWSWAHVAVLIKRFGARFAANAHAAGVPVVWDALDFWAQPGENSVDPARARALLDAQLVAIKPALTIGATQAMAEAAQGSYLPHHSWAGLVPTPPRAVVQRVAYQGNPTYLGRWQSALMAACTKRGWTFEINPATLADVDVLVALRDGPWDGWICREWKSGVKLVNALAAGRPVLTQLSAASRELLSCGGAIVQHDELDDMLGVTAHRSMRDLAYADGLQRATRFTVESIAERYHDILSHVRATCAA